ncbi:hypothetical protein NDU88_005233 [Pleurodeles waltl]|uniref:Uncharacterized protein n=1 Tax=Pleurodeles waltl TaxID=8319 RepID=A0AAV7M8Q3_PLEWA|nr:hypothetical protein NDU88_005233 [Pleurodeles waltl]
MTAYTHTPCYSSALTPSVPSRIARRASSPHLISRYPRFSRGATGRYWACELSRRAPLFWAPASVRPPPGATLRRHAGPPRGRPSTGRRHTQDRRALIRRSACLFYRKKGHPHTPLLRSRLWQHSWQQNMNVTCRIIVGFYGG